LVNLSYGDRVMLNVLKYIQRKNKWG